MSLDKEPSLPAGEDIVSSVRPLESWQVLKWLLCVNALVNGAKLQTTGRSRSELLRSLSL